MNLSSLNTMIKSTEFLPFMEESGTKIRQENSKVELISLWELLEEFWTIFRKEILTSQG